ncbi:MAG: transketolase C-terminal domain-containing protein [Candidatus Firestonebacteria bacterium]
MMEMRLAREAFGDMLVKLGKTNNNIVVMDADLSKSTMTWKFAKEFQERFFDMGIAEQDMTATAAGLALAGKIPFIATYGVFLPGRCWDQVRISICYANLNVKIAVAHGGVSVGPDGATHQALEDISLLRCLPNMTVLVPADAVEMEKCMAAIVEYVGPVAIRFGREKVPVITSASTPFVIGKSTVLREGKDVTIIGIGSLMLYEAMLAADELAKKNISVRIINMYSVKPIDKEAIIKACEETKGIVTVEEHTVMGGFGSAVAEVVVQNKPVKMRLVGTQDRFGESGKPAELLQEFGLTSPFIQKAVLEVLK